MYYPPNDLLMAYGFDSLSAFLNVSTDGNTFTKYRFPKAHVQWDEADVSWTRTRHIQTGTMLADMHGIFYQLQRSYGGRVLTPGFIPIPICRHMSPIEDFTTYLGWLVLGSFTNWPRNWERSRADTALILMKPDDLWSYGDKPRGFGGVWKDTSISAGATSDPFLIYGFDMKTLHLWSDTAGTFTIEVDPVGDGSWKTYDTVSLTATKLYDKYIITGDAVWCRVKFDTAAKVGAWFHLR
jgi:hypothetical protein